MQRAAKVNLPELAIFLLLAGLQPQANAANQPEDTTVSVNPPSMQASSARSNSSDNDSSPASDVAKTPQVLEGKAEVSTTREGNTLRAWKASQDYRQGVAALGVRNFRQAANCFKKAGDGFESTVGYEKFLGESRFAEAQARKFLGETHEAARLYQAAIDLFQEYDPLSPYQKAAFDALKKCAPTLTGRVKQAEARLQALTKPTRIMIVDRNIVLKGRISEKGNAKLLAEKGTSDVPHDYVDKTIKKAFVRMTCLETAELGSNVYTYQNRWMPLIANGRTVTISASSDFLAPMISVKINGKFHNVAVDLPDLSSNRHTVFLLTDGQNIVAIDPATEDMWELVGKFRNQDAQFSWKKLSHYKRGRPKPPPPTITN